MTSVPRWDLLELQVDGPTTVQFHHEHGASAWAESFRSGERWLLRFMPDLEGTWRVDGDTTATTGYSSLTPFTCTPATSRGPIRRSGTTLRFADGTPYHPLTTTWFGSADQWDEACRAIATSPFNRVRLRAGALVEQQVRDLLAVDVAAEILLPSDEVVIRDLVNRLAAYRNVSWCLEARGEARDLAELIAELDSSRHLISIHSSADPGTPWSTHVSVELENLRGVSALRRDYAKPVFVDACGFEGNGITPNTSLRPEEMLTRIWEGTVRGAYVTHGEWYVDAGGGPWSSGGTRPVGVVAQRLRLLREVLDDLPDGVEPIDDYRDAPTLAVPGEYYLQYLGEHQFPDRTFSLPTGTYDIDVLDVWTHSIHRTQETVTNSNLNPNTGDGTDIGDDTGTLTVRLPGTQYQAIRIRRAP